MRIRPFEQRRKPDFRCRLNRLERPERPGVNDVIFSRQLPEPPGDDFVMQNTGAHPAQQPVRQTQFSPRQRGLDLDSRRNRAMQRSSNDGHVRTGGVQAQDLLPCGVANPIRAQFVRKAVENPDWPAVL